MSEKVDKYEKRAIIEFIILGILFFSAGILFLAGVAKVGFILSLICVGWYIVCFIDNGISLGFWSPDY